MIHPMRAIPRPVTAIAVSLTALVSTLATSATASAAAIISPAPAATPGPVDSVAIPSASSLLGLPAITWYWIVAGVLVTWAGLVLASRPGRRHPVGLADAGLGGMPRTLRQSRTSPGINSSSSAELVAEFRLPYGMV